MFKTISIQAYLPILLWCLAATTLEARLWTDSTGNFTVEAELVTIRQENVYLENTKGEIKKVPLGKLSKADLQYLGSLPKYRDALKSYLPEEPSSRPANANQVDMVEIKSNIEEGSVRFFRSPSWGYKGIAFSNDGGYIVALGSDNLTIFDVNKAKLAALKLDRSVGRLQCLRFSPDGSKLFAGNDEGQVFAWEFSKGQLDPLQKFDIYDDDVKSVIVSPDGKHGLSTHYNDTACLWSIESGKVLASYTDFYFSSNSSLFFSAKGGQGLITDGAHIAVIDTASHEMLQAMQISRHAASTHSSAIAPDGSCIAACGGREIKVWEPRTGKQLPPLETKEIQWSAEFGVNPQILVTGGSAVVYVWDLENGRLGHKFDMRDSGYVKHVAVSPDGRHIAAVGAPIGGLVEVFRLPPDLVK